MDFLTLLEYGSLYISGLEHRSGHFFVYVKAYQDLSLKSLLLWLVFSARAPGSLAGGFLVAVAGCAPWLCFCFVLVLRDFRCNSPIFRFTFSPAQWASPQLNGPVQHFSDRDS